MMDKVTTVAVPAIHAKMIAVMRDVDAVGKTSRNQQQGFNYRGIDSIYNAINPVLAKHGVFMTAEILDKSREERVTKRESGKDSVLAFTCLRMRYSFWAEDGSHVETEAEGEGMDSGDKSSNKAMAIAHKYALLQAFCIPTEDIDDPDAETHEVAPKQPAQTNGTKPNGNGAANGKEPATPRVRAAQTWADEAMALIRSTNDSAKFDKWHTDNTKAIAALQPLVPEAHKKLLEAIETRRVQLHPASA